MASTLAIFKKEFRSYFNSPIAYVFLTVYLVVTNGLFFPHFFLAGQADMRRYFTILPWIFLFFVPAITMRLWSEEKKSGTIELLMTLPIRHIDLVLGKFLASLAFLCIGICLSLTVPITLALVGDPESGSIIGSYLGTFLMGAAYLSIGLFISGVTENQIVAFIVSVAATFAAFMIGEGFITFILPGALIPLFEYLGLGQHFQSISRGVVDSRDIVYYLSVIGIFLYLNVQTLENRRVNG